MRRQIDENVRISKALSYILRHGAIKEGIAIEADGYVKLTDILARNQFKHCSVKTVEDIVNTNDKKRFELCMKNETWYIRATQGHSITKVQDQELLEPVVSSADIPILVHGTYLSKWKLIKNEGLKAMNRNHIHLAPGMPEESQVISGMRSNCNVYIFIDGDLAMQDGIEFFKSTNNVILTKGINGVLPLKYFKTVQTRTNQQLKTIFTNEGGQIKIMEIDEEEKKVQAVNKPVQNEIPLNQNFYPIDYLLVLDFEAQCSEESKLDVQEIIEFPVVPIDMKTQQILYDKIFHFYLKPVVVPILTSFCTKLTGIQQNQVDSGIQLTEALSELHQYLEKTKFIKSKFAFITCGDWDIKICLPNECQAKSIALQDYLKRWINIKEVFANYVKKLPGMPKRKSHFDMKEMLDFLKLPLDGRHHSGIDDAKNIAKIAIKLLELNQKIDFSYLKPKGYQKEFLQN